MTKTKATFLIDSELYIKFKIKNVKEGRKNSHVVEKLIKIYSNDEKKIDA